MISFRYYLYLIEDRIEYLTNRYKDINAHHDTYASYKKSEDIIKFWIKVDPTPNKKYLDWLLRQYSRQDFRQEDAQRVHDALENFERYKARLAQKDINHYYHLSDLEDTVEAVNGTKSKREEIRDIKHDGADKIFDKGGVKVYHIKTEAAAKFYGKGTKWCTAADKNCLFNKYNQFGPLYVVLCKGIDNKPAKYQFHFDPAQFKDEKDREISITSLVKRNPELQDVPEFQGEKVVLTKAKDINKYFDKLLLSDPKNAIKDSSITPENISKALNNLDSEVRGIAAKHPNATSEHITKALNDPSSDVRLRAIRYPKATSEQISKALNDPSSDVRDTAIRHPKATSEHITKALDDSSSTVRWTAIRHPKVTLEHITKALNNPDLGIRRMAISHPKATLEHITKALDDSDPEVRVQAIRHPNVTSEHITKALNDSDSDVRDVAKRIMM